MLIKKPINKSLAVFLNVLSVLIMLAIYSLLAYRQHDLNPDDTTIPTWHQIFDGFKKIISVQRGEIWIVEDSKASILRLTGGLFFGITASIIIGIGMGCHKSVAAFFLPPLSLLAKIPPTAMLAVFFVLAGTNMPMFISMIAFGVFPALSQAVYLSIRDIPDELLNKAHTLGASYFEVIFNVVIPSIMPKLIDAIRLQIGPAMVYLIAAEMVAADAGFGFRIRLQSRLINMNVVYIYLAFLAIFGYAVDYLLRLFQSFVCPWYSEERN